jgi:hypothetical protein
MGRTTEERELLEMQQNIHAEKNGAIWRGSLIFPR